MDAANGAAEDRGNSMKTVMISSVKQSETNEAFHVKDQSGRWVGCNIILVLQVFEQSPEGISCYYVNVPPGTYYTVSVQASRNGNDFGASQPFVRFETAEKRAEWIKKTVASRRKAAEKKFAA